MSAKIKSWFSWNFFRKTRLSLAYWWSALFMKIRMFCVGRDTGAWFFFGGLGLALVFLGALMYKAVSGMVVDEDITCLARNVYYEARGESLKGQRAVAKVTLNRLASNRFPNTLCEVVYEKRWDKRRRRYVGAFAWTELDKLPPLKRRQWKRAWKAAESVYEDPDSVELKGALFYHSTRIKPRWARQKKRVKRIGHHIFYR